MNYEIQERVQDDHSFLFSMANTYHKQVPNTTTRTAYIKLKKETKPIFQNCFFYVEFAYSGCEVLICCFKPSDGCCAETSGCIILEAAMVWYCDGIVGAIGCE
jgi:hypothetical protein